MLGYWNNGILMLIKRTFSRRDWSQMDELINCLLTEDDISQNAWAIKCLDNTHLRPYFKNLHLHVISRNLHHYKGYQTLNDGIYVLLKGEIRFSFDDRYTQKQKMKRSKTINLRTQSAVIINQPWQVFESTLKNCTTSMETFLLKITEEQALSTSFYELSQMRHQLYAKQYLSLDHQRLLDIQETRKAFIVDMKIHSHFSFKKYSFRQVVSLTSPAIISSGRAKLKLKNVYSREFDQCGVLLPNLQYEVTSSELEIMIVQDNETLCYMFEQKEQENEEQQLKHHHSCKRTLNSLHKVGSNTHKHYQSQLKGKQRDKKAREMSKVFKEVEPYSIISSHLCQKSLNFAKKHNLIHNTRKKKQNRYVHPLILFNIASQKSKLDFPSFSNQPRLGQKDKNIKHLSAHKSVSQSESQSSILRKIKLSRQDYNNIVNKYRQLPTEVIKRKTFKLITDKVQTNCDDQQFS